MPPIIDPQAKTGIIADMFRRIIHGAIKSSIDELLREPLQGIRADMGRISSDVRELKEGQRRLETRMDRMDARIDGLAMRMDGFAEQQGRLIGAVEQLRADVTILKAN